MQESTVTIKGQTTLPKDVRTALRLSPGDRVRYMILDGGEVRLVRSGPASRLAGVLKGRSGRVVSLEDMEAAIVQGAQDQGRAGR
jgi:antitoxin PrlF